MNAAKPQGFRLSDLARPPSGESDDARAAALKSRHTLSGGDLRRLRLVRVKCDRCNNDWVGAVW
jgi:hypothetical protein